MLLSNFEVNLSHSECRSVLSADSVFQRFNDRAVDNIPLLNSLEKRAIALN